MPATTGSPAPPQARGTIPAPPRGGRGKGSRTLPYLLLLPAAVLLAVVLGYPIVRLVGLSLNRAKLRDLVKGTESWNNFANYTAILSDATFWAVLGRTIVFAAACVVATMVLGMMLALLLAKLGRVVRLILSISLLMAWSTPQVTATQVWQWLFDTRYGLVNWALVRAGLTGFDNHSWLAAPASLLTVAGAAVVWGALPFVALTLYAGRTQIDESLYEAAGMDGATPWQAFRSITVPMLAPIITMLAALSTIWDFRVFTQVYLLQQAGGITSETNLISIHAYRTSFSGNDFGSGAAISVVMVLVLAGFSIFYVRRMLKEVQS
ncbi:sugar ABC transporter permease [Tessaracoccus antarcticus]|uniref:Sugar ABC transporter permease n=2 Tax=Tessaracoccus antarcticus TaxID=2479848 RepID=A0A3M0GSL6_9ACTN|nr:sugar ABC transporter permease [Tessaracoccus antarcticus]